MAEKQGFEPWEGYKPSTVFKAPNYSFQNNNLKFNPLIYKAIQYQSNSFNTTQTRSRCPKIVPNFSEDVKKWTPNFGQPFKCILPTHPAT